MCLTFPAPVFRASGIGNELDPKPEKILHECKCGHSRIPASFLENSSLPVPASPLFDAAKGLGAPVTKDKAPDLCLMRPHGCHHGDVTLAMPAENRAQRQETAMAEPCGTAGARSSDIRNSALYRCPRRFTRAAQNGYLKINDRKVNGPETQSTRYCSPQHHASVRGTQGRKADGCPFGHVSP